MLQGPEPHLGITIELALGMRPEGELALRAGVWERADPSTHLLEGSLGAEVVPSPELSSPLPFLSLAFVAPLIILGSTPKTLPECQPVIQCTSWTTPPEGSIGSMM